MEVQAVQQVGQVRVLRRSGIPLYGAALRPDAMDARQADYSRCALAIGSEGRGLSREGLDLCDKTVLIPMSPRCESLNAAIAAAVLFCWQGSIYLFAGVIAPYLTPGMMTEISLLGGIFLLSSGVGILQLRDCKTLNMLPSLLVPPLWFTILSFLQ